MDFDPNSVLVGGASAFVLLLFIVQTIREAFSFPSKYIPLLAVGAGVAMLLFGVYAPENVVSAVAQGLLLAAAVSGSVRYVKESGNATAGHSDLQGYDVEATRVSTSGTPAEGVGAESGYSGVRDFGGTERIPILEEEQRSRN